MNKKQKEDLMKTEIAVGVAVATAALAGYYFYASKDAKKHRKAVSTWMGNLKEDVMQEAKRLQVATPEAFAIVVDSIASTYAKAKDVNASELAELITELKENWDDAKKDIAKKAGSAKKISKKVKSK